MDERLSILEMVEQGRIGVDEAVGRLKALNSDRPFEQEGWKKDERVEVGSTTSTVAKRPVSGRVAAAVWQIVFGGGVVVLVGGGFLLARFYGGEAAHGRGWGWSLFVVGVLLIMLGWWLRRATWLGIRVREHDGGAFNLAIPLPVGLAAWAVRLGGRFVPELDQDEVDALADAVRNEFDGEGMFSVHVDEGESGDQVEVTIG